MVAKYLHELHLHTNYSFHDGASSVDELVAHAADLGYQTLAVTDHDNLCGAVHFAETCHDAGIQPIIGCEVNLIQNHHLTLLAESRLGYSNLCWLLSNAYQKDRREPALDPSLFEGHTQGLIALSGCYRGEVPSLVQERRFDEARSATRRYRDLFGPEGYFLELQQHFVKGDTQRNRWLLNWAREFGMGVVATGNVHYHVRDRSRLQDCLVAIKHNATLKETHRKRRPNSEFFLKEPSEMTKLFQECSEAIENTARIADRCASFDLNQDLGYQFPSHEVPAGHTPQSYLEKLCHEAARRRYGKISPKVQDRLQKEFDLIRTHDLAGFMLIYRDIIEMAHEVAVDLGLTDRETPFNINPPGRGRGSSVSMLVGYLFGISHIDPLKYGLSLERFLPDDKLASVPDIDLDFPRNIREELILRVHKRFGWDKAALTGMIPTYRTRSCVRDLGKVLGLPPDEIGKLAKRTDDGDGLSLREIMLGLPDFQHKADTPLWKHMANLASQLEGFPKYLAQHPGGMVISSTPLTEIVPILPSAIEGRYVMQWDKNSIQRRRFIKIDLLAVGALSQIQDILKLIEKRHGKIIDLSRINFEDDAVYGMLHKADTIGIFQVESPAQMQAITRIRPKNLTDMAHEVAAIRPGVGANDAVRQYIARRQGLQSDVPDHPLLERALGRTHNVILFQDQINQVAHDVGGLSHAEAENLRRAFTRRNNDLAIARWWERFRDGAQRKGVDEEIARLIFRRFNGHYMFPESHAFAFGITAYQLSWLKYHYPIEFFLALFNQQPMGFYTPETLKEDAKRHDVTILNPDVNRSKALCTDEGTAIRIGLLYVRSIGKKSAEAIIVARSRAPFSNLADVISRSGLHQKQLEDLIDAGATDSLHDDRREARWEVGLRYNLAGRQLPLDMSVEPYKALLPRESPYEKMANEYRTMGIHPTNHAMAYVRDRLDKHLLSSDALPYACEGQQVTVAGLVIRRQRPLAKALFITLEDERGHIPMVIWPTVYRNLRSELKAPFLIATGTISHREHTTNIIVQHVKPIYVIQDPPKSRNFQ